jgi:hypothetical protein
MGINIELVTAGPAFFITAEPAMPQVTVRAVVDDADADALTYNWSVSIVFDATKCRHGRPANSTTSSFSAITTVPEFTPEFPEIRGGDLQIGVSVSVADQTITAATTGLKIGGTNPALADLRDAIVEEPLRRLVRQESGGRQFVAAPEGGQALCPLFSGDNLGGAGLLQVTNPAPTQDEIWSWRANVAAARRLWAQKVAVAKAFPQRCHACDTFQQLAAEFNQDRQSNGLAPLTIAVPAFTDDQFQLDAIRGYNGYAGRDFLGLYLHEFRVAVRDGRLVINDNGDGTGSVLWERVPVEDRPASGDPKYVENVMRYLPI